MKTNKLTLLVIAFLTAISFTSCVEDGDFTVPEALNPEETQEVQNIISELNDPNGNLDEISISTLKSLFVSGEATEITSETVLVAYVSSSDRTGNFFREIYVQDKPENPEAAIHIALDFTDSYNKFNPGRKVYIKLQGLFIGETRSGNGVISLGRQDGDLVDNILIQDIEDRFFRSAETAELVAKPMSISAITDANIGMYVQIENAQFLRSIKGETFVDRDAQFDTSRTFESCSESASFPLETSSFAQFKFAPLPEKSFTIKGIITNTFNGSNLVMVLNDKNDIIETGERCDPDFVDCTTASGGGSAFFSENFENFNGYAAEGWDNINVSNTNLQWVLGSFSGSTYAQISGFRSGNSEDNVWLVTPAIDMDNTTGEELSFDIQANFDNATNLTVLVSQDYAGDPTTATWRPLDVNIPTGPSSGFGTFQAVGPVNISCLDGTIYIGFFYEGSDPNATTRYHIDNIEVTGN